MYSVGVNPMSVSEARAALPEILDRVDDGEEITITRHGQAVAVVVRPDRLRARRADQTVAAAERVRALLDRGRSRPLRAHPRLGADRADDLVADVRAGRSRR
jgi:antitoxin (DNA-binding transcriptional repressor) of toxin-antitoxin stability system